MPRKTRRRVPAQPGGIPRCRGPFSFGPVTKVVSGDGEYEYWYTIDAEYLPRLLTLLGGQPGDDILTLLEQKWTGKRSDELGPMLRESDIPVNFSSYSG